MADRLSELKTIFDAKKFRPRKYLGQNFCIDPNLLDSIPRRAGVEKSDFVLEIGCGTGLLTKFLAAEAGYILSVEIDPVLMEIARAHAAECPNVEFLECDALERKNLLNPLITGRVSEILAEGKYSGFKLVSNLPYAVATPVIMNMLDMPRKPDSMTFLIQKEVAERITARHHTKKFGPLAILLRVFYEPEIIKIFSPKVFWPRPEVESALIRLDSRVKPLAVADWPFFRNFIRRLFIGRRKKVKNILSGRAFSDEERESALRALCECGIDEGLRPEEIPLEKIARLAETAFRLFDETRGANL
jgi:16S rRNA (adenine1518-N6/adenine1519-N6)-dimethyltransferase